MQRGDGGGGFWACFHLTFTEEYGADVLNNIQVLFDSCVKVCILFYKSVE